MMSERRQLVAESWKVLQPQSFEVGATFFCRLFEIDPALRSLFATTILDEHVRKLMSMFDLVVHWLDAPERLVPALKQLGARHASYGVVDEHYSKLGSALIATLEEHLGPRFTPEVRGAWTEAYLLMSSLMRRGAAKVSGTFPALTLEPSPPTPIVNGDAA